MRLRVLIAAAVAAAVLVAPATARGSSAQATETLNASRVLETTRGTTRTLDLPGDRYLVVHAFGAVSVADGDGRPVWSLGTQSLYDDWDITWTNSSGGDTPQLAWGSSPVDPLEFFDAGSGMDVANTHPFAAGQIGGREVVAVAETVGVDMTDENSCELCTWPFDVPGSSLHLGTFVSVLDASTGQVLYHEVDPGYVTQLAIADGRLIIGDETGDPQDAANGIGTWGSVSTLRALAFTPGWRATQAWEYSTGSEWGRLLDVTVTGSGDVALAWSDTPPGLGTPRPPERTRGGPVHRPVRGDRLHAHRAALWRRLDGAERAEVRRGARLAGHWRAGLGGRLDRRDHRHGRGRVHPAGRPGHPDRPAHRKGSLVGGAAIL